MTNIIGLSMIFYFPHYIEATNVYDPWGGANLDSQALCMKPTAHYIIPISSCTLDIAIIYKLWSSWYRRRSFF